MRTVARTLGCVVGIGLFGSSLQAQTLRIPKEVFEIATTGKLPDSQLRFVGNYWDVYGKKHDVEIIRCFYCGDVISEVHHNCEKQHRSGFSRSGHNCHKM